VGCSRFRLTSASIDDLIVWAQANDSDDGDAMREVLRRFVPLARRLAWRYANRSATVDDLTNAALVAGVTCVRRHRPSRGGFSMYMRSYMRGAVLRELKRLSSEDVLTGDGHVDAADRSDPASVGVWGDGDLADAVAQLSPAQQRLLAMRYVTDLPLKEIAAVTGCTVPAVSQRLGTAHAAVRRELAAA
jgi:RNA polymerase sigma factor (sigma-70 family)